MPRPELAPITPISLLARAARQLAAGACLALFLGSAGAAGPWTFFFVSQALEQLAQAAVARVLSPQASPGAGAPPTWEASLGAAELLNEKLPMTSADGFAFMRVRAPAPGALEIQAQAPNPAPSASDLDAAWGPGLGRLFCSSESNLWSRWVAIGGTVGIDVRTTDGESVRRYGISRADCAILARRSGS